MKSNADLDHLISRGVSAVVEAIRLREVTSVELVAHCLQRIDALDPSINAMVYTDRRGAGEAATRLDENPHAGCLAGVPIVIKDNIAVRGMPFTAGIRAYAERVAEGDAPLISGLKREGAIILGKATLHEGALGATNDNPFSGRTHHPQRHGYTPGGSSGGSAAAVASAMVPGAIGSDTLGSVRVPGSYCGLTALKPSNGLVSVEGITPLDVSLDTAGPMARTVHDLRLMMQAIADPASSILWLDTAPVALQGRRIAIAKNPGTLEIDPPVQERFLQTVAQLEAAGCAASEFRLHALDLAKIRRAGFTFAQRGAIEHHGDVMAQDPEGFSAQFHASAKWVAGLTDERIEAAQMIRAKTSAFLHDTLSDAEFIVTPTTPQTAFSFDSPVPASQADLTSLANLAGLPAITLPDGCVDGLPTGLQIMGRHGSDADLLDFAEQIEGLFDRARRVTVAAI